METWEKTWHKQMRKWDVNQEEKGSEPRRKGMGTQGKSVQEPRGKEDRNSGERGTGTKEKRGQQPRRKGDRSSGDKGAV